MFKKTQPNKTFSWILVILWMLIIFWFSSISGSSLKTDGVTDGQYNLISSLAHIILYIVLTWLLVRALLNSSVKIKKAVVIAFLVSIIYGLVDELHQYWTPGREVHFSDWLLDVAGSFITASIYIWRYKIKKIFS